MTSKPLPRSWLDRSTGGDDGSTDGDDGSTDGDDVSTDGDDVYTDTKKRKQTGPGRTRSHAGKGKTGVEFRYYETEEFYDFSEDQNGPSERSKNRGAGGSGKGAQCQILALHNQNLQLMKQIDELKDH